MPLAASRAHASAARPLAVVLTPHSPSRHFPSFTLATRLPTICLPSAPRLCASFCPLSGPAALLSHVSRIRRDGVLVVECVVQWRRCLVASDPDGMSLVAAAEGSTSSAAAAAFAPFLWRGADYLARMLHDVDFLAELGAAPRVLELGAEALHFNPLFAPTTLSNAVRMPPLPSVAEHLIDRCAQGRRAAAALL